MADINKTRAQVAAILLSVGDNSALTTGNKLTLVAAINEVDHDVGDLTNLETDNKSSLVAAVNEIETNAGRASRLIGNLDDLVTTDKSTMVAAVNEVKLSVGNLSSLQTADKTSTVAAINEVKQYVVSGGMPLPSVAVEGNVAVFDGGRCVMDAGYGIATIEDNQAIIDDYAS